MPWSLGLYAEQWKHCGRLRFVQHVYCVEVVEPDDGARASCSALDAEGQRDDNQSVGWRVPVSATHCPLSPDKHSLPPI